MVNDKYKDLCNKMVVHYKKVHVCPWHNISEEELNNYINEFFKNNNVDNEYIFEYLILTIIKKVSGTKDCHTTYDKARIIPMNFKIFDNEVFVNFPENLKGYRVLSINGIDINSVIDEMENIITYGTLGRRRNEIEKNLFNEYALYGLPSLRNSKSLTFHLENVFGDIKNVTFPQGFRYPEETYFDYEKYSYGIVADYEFKDGILIYRHSSINNKFKDKIESTIDKLKIEDTSNINTIIVDLRGNSGGSSKNNEPLIDYQKTHSGKRISCLTDYRVFAGGRYALVDLMNLGAITIGEEIGTPLNCFGNNNWQEFDGHYFSSSSSYLDPVKRWGANSKEEYQSRITPELLKEIIFKPDIPIYQTKEDYLNGIDTILEYALKYAKNS